MRTSSDDVKLHTWAEIASHIGRDVRTAKRYEIDRGLPVRRLPGSRSTVFALAADLDAWMRGEIVTSPTLPEAAASPVEPAPTAHRVAQKAQRRRPIRLAAACLSAAAMVLVAASGLGWRRWAPAPVSATSMRAQALYSEGVYAYNRRSPEGIATALDRFTQAVVQDPSYAEAYAGLADAFELAPEFSQMASSDAFPRAEAAAQRALSLNPRLFQAHRALAFVAFWWDHDPARSSREFEIAIHMSPQAAMTHLWYANTLAAQLDPRAYDEINVAERLEPNSTAIKADKAWIAYMFGHPKAAIELLNTIEAVDPSYAALYRYRAQAEMRLGLDTQMLQDWRREGELTHDAALVRLADVGSEVAAAGHAAIYSALCAEGERAFAAGHFGASRLAALEIAAGHPARSVALLRIARSDRRWSAMATTDPVFAPLRLDQGKSTRTRDAAI